MKRDEKLLLVEDNPTIAAALGKAGERLNLHVEVATDGWDAIEKLRIDSYGGIVIDIDVPRHSGYGVLTYLRQEHGDDFENVIVMTSDDDTSVRHRVSERLNVVRKTQTADEVAELVAQKLIS